MGLHGQKEISDQKEVRRQRTVERKEAFLRGVEEEKNRKEVWEKRQKADFRGLQKRFEKGNRMQFGFLEKMKWAIEEEKNKSEV